MPRRIEALLVARGGQTPYPGTVVICIDFLAVPSESIHTPGLFPHLVLSLTYLHTIPQNVKVELCFLICFYK
jgi:hypothetical protein